MYTHHKNQIYYWLDRLIKYSFLKQTNWSKHDWRTNLKIGYSQIFWEPFLCSKWIGRASDSHIYLTLRYNAKLRHSQFCSVVEVDALQFRRVLTRLTISLQCSFFQREVNNHDIQDAWKRNHIILVTWYVYSVSMFSAVLFTPIFAAKYGMKIIR